MNQDALSPAAGSAGYSDAPGGREPMPHIAVRRGDAATPVAHGLMPVVIVLDRLRSAFNVGNIFRLADAVRAERIVTCGCTATPPHPKLARTARGCDALVPAEHWASAADAVVALRARGRTVYAVETAVGAAPVWAVEFRFPAAFVFGNEALGVATDTLEACDAVVALPMFGCKNSINVGNCAAVVLYAAARQWHPRAGER
jgi:tRNA G18 (ribose-2'-O)-methylase SpoU